ncbi:MAG: 50S ribosomal protein L23 [bacterium]|nr:50S ribosomal protein L23 [bacterium]
MKTNHVIVKPVLTEKAINLAKTSVYTFEINSKATKDQVTTVLEELYGVKVKEVRIMNKKGKKRRVGRSMKTKQLSGSKIARVQVTQGKIDLFPTS